MIEKDIEIDTWYDLDSYVRKLSSNWASLMSEALELDDENKSMSEDYKSLSIAALSSSSDFWQQWKKTIGDTSKHAEIAEDLKNKSNGFRKPKTLIKNAMLATKSEIWYGKRALKTAENYRDYEDVVFKHLPAKARLVIDHAVYALYVAWSPNTRIIVPDNRPKLLKAMALDENIYRIISPRQFEELVAYLYECLGCKVELTQATRDFGADILAWHGGPFNSETLIAVQVKRYAKHNKVTLKSIFELHGAVAHYGADQGQVITSSDFTKPARTFAEAQRIQLINLESFQEELIKFFKA